MITTTLPDETIKLKRGLGARITLTAIVQKDMGDDHETVFQDASGPDGSAWSRRKNKFYPWSKWRRAGGRVHCLDAMSEREIAQL